MAGYQYLTAEDQQRIIEEVQASIPSVESLLRSQEEAHFRAVVRAKFGLGPMPDDFDADGVLASRDGVKAQSADEVAQGVYAELAVAEPVAVKVVG